MPNIEKAGRLADRVLSTQRSACSSVCWSCPPQHQKVGSQHSQALPRSPGLKLGPGPEVGTRGMAQLSHDGLDFRCSGVPDGPVTLHA